MSESLLPGVSVRCGSECPRVFLYQLCFFCRVSSVLQNKGKLYGKQFLTDGCDDTCWNSEGGRPQFIALSFPQPVVVEQIVLLFQGGFVGKECRLDGSLLQSRISLGSFVPANGNAEQVFDVPNPSTVDALTLIFEDSTDFFGRIIVYKLDVLGRPALDPTTKAQ